MSCNVYRFFLYFMIILVSTVASAEFEINPKIQFSVPISPSGLTMAVVVGPGKRSFSNTKNSFVYLLDLNTSKAIKIQETENAFALGLSWRNQKEIDELYLTLIDFNKPYVFSMMGITENGSNVFLKNEAKKVITRSFKWSPNGEILAGCCASEPGEALTDGYFGVSYNGGEKVQTLKKLSCDVYTPPVWISNKELYVYGSYYMPDESGDSLFKTIGYIYKVSLGNKKHIDTEKVIEGESVKLYGAINNDCVYRVNDSICFGSKKIYSSKKMGVIVSGNRIAIESSDESKIKVINSDGNVLYEKLLKEKQHLYAFSSDTGKIFVLENKKRILQWDIEEKLDSVVVFEVVSHKNSSGNN